MTTKKGKMVVEDEAVSAENDALEAEFAELRAEKEQLQARLAEINKMLPHSHASSPRTGVGKRTKELIAENPEANNAQIVAMLDDEFPLNKNTVQNVAYYRNALKNWPDGKRPPAKKKDLIDEDEGDESDVELPDEEDFDEEQAA